MKHLEHKESERQNDIRREPSVRKVFKVNRRDIEDIHAIQEDHGLGPKFRREVQIDMYVKWRRSNDLVYHGTDGRYVLPPDGIREYSQKAAQYKDALVRETGFNSDNDRVEAWNLLRNAFGDNGQTLPEPEKRTLSTMKAVKDMFNKDKMPQEDPGWEATSSTAFTAATGSEGLHVTGSATQKSRETGDSWSHVLTRYPDIKDRQGNLSIED